MAKALPNIYFIATGRAGGIKFDPRSRERFLAYLKNNDGVRLYIAPVLPEPKKLRRYFEGAIIPLLTYYQETLDHHDPDDRDKVREWIKMQFNAELVTVKGISQRVGKSTKGRDTLVSLFKRVMDWLVENYDPPTEAINPESYKEWRDTVFSSGGADNYIDYLVEIGVLPTKGEWDIHNIT